MTKYAYAFLILAITSIVTGLISTSDLTQGQALTEGWRHWLIAVFLMVAFIFELRGKQ